jgi:DNA-directed RNA polymerase specialized sigma24 family protein
MTAGQEEAASAPPGTQLVADAAAGDSQAWERLVEAYAQLIGAITGEAEIVERDAADVTPVTWLRLLEHGDPLGHPSRVRSRLPAVARHECLSSVAAPKKAVLGPDGDTPEGVPAHGPEIDERLLAAGRAQRMREALSRLPPGAQQLLEMLMADPPACYGDVRVARPSGREHRPRPSPVPREAPRAAAGP